MLTQAQFKELVFTVQDIVQVMDITIASARVMCSRYVNQGRLIRLRKGLYIFPERWEHLSPFERLQIANRIQPASYISLGTALAWYEKTKQMYQKRVESIACKRSIKYEVAGWEYAYHQIGLQIYNGYERREGAFIALPEKALADIIYLQSLGRYAFDFAALDWEAFNQETLLSYLNQLPGKTQQWWERYGSISRS